MDQVFSLEKQNIKKVLGKWKKKTLEKSGNFVSPENWQPCGLYNTMKIGVHTTPIGTHCKILIIGVRIGQS